MCIKTVQVSKCSHPIYEIRSIIGSSVLPIRSKRNSTREFEAIYSIVTAALKHECSSRGMKKKDVRRILKDVTFLFDLKIAVGLVQPFVAFQAFFTSGRSAFIELTVTDTQRTRHRLIFSSSFIFFSVNPLHAQIPLHVPRDTWLTLCIDVDGFCVDCFSQVKITRFQRRKKFRHLLGLCDCRWDCGWGSVYAPKNFYPSPSSI